MLKRAIRASIYSIALKLCSLLPIDENKVVFDNFDGQGFSGNSKYIALELLNRPRRMKLYWIVDEISKYDIPKEIIQVKQNSIKAAYHLETAKLWVDNVRKGRVIKRKNQLYLQAWHGLIGIKKIENEVPNIGEKYRYYAIKDSRNIDAIISTCTRQTYIMQNYFWLDDKKKIYEFGSPEYDLLYNANSTYISEMKKKLGIEKKKILLYAPTFRKDKKYNYFDIDFKQIIAQLSERFGGEWILAVRLHPNVRNLMGQAKINCEYVDMTQHEDQQEIVLIADAILTDYSSLVFGGAVMYKPCFLFAPDYKAYINERDYEFEQGELPFNMLQNNSTLLDEIKNYDEKSSKERIDKFFAFIGLVFDGKASQRTVDWIEKNIVK